MQCRSEHIATTLSQQLYSCILIYGDELLLQQEAADAVRGKLKQAGVTERKIWYIDKEFDWQQLTQHEQNLSLFSEKKSIELRFQKGALTAHHTKALRQFIATLSPDTYVLMLMGKIERNQQKSRWFKDIDTNGLTVPIWPITAAQLPAWIRQRMLQRQLTIDDNTLTLMTLQLEGNLLAAAQEIDKLVLLCPDGVVTEQIVTDSMADNARFQSFILMDKVMQGQVKQISRIIALLRAEGNELLAILSAVSWSVQRLVNMAQALAEGETMAQLFQQQKPPIVWDKAKAMTKAILLRHPTQRWPQFLLQLAAIDRAAKGESNLCPWSLLEILCINLAGQDNYLTEGKANGY